VGEGERGQYGRGKVLPKGAQFVKKKKQNERRKTMDISGRISDVRDEEKSDKGLGLGGSICCATTNNLVNGEKATEKKVKKNRPKGAVRISSDPRGGTKEGYKPQHLAPSSGVDGLWGFNRLKKGGVRVLDKKGRTILAPRGNI